MISPEIPSLRQIHQEVTQNALITLEQNAQWQIVEQQKKEFELEESQDLGRLALVDAVEAITALNAAGASPDATVRNPRLGGYDGKKVRKKVAGFVISDQGHTSSTRNEGCFNESLRVIEILGVDLELYNYIPSLRLGRRYQQQESTIKTIDDLRLHRTKLAGLLARKKVKLP